MIFNLELCDSYSFLEKIFDSGIPKCAPNEWLDMNMEDDVVQRQVRSKLRSIAKENSATYQSATVNLDTITPTLPK